MTEVPFQEGDRVGDILKVPFLGGVAQSVERYVRNVLVGETKAEGTSGSSTDVFVRDPASLEPLSSTDANGNSTTNTYNSAGGVLSTTDALGNTTQSAYDNLNQPWCTVDAADYRNGARCPSSAPSSPPAPGASDPDLGMTIRFYDASGLLTATTDALGNTTTYSYTDGVSGVPNGLEYCSVDPADYQRSVSCPAYGASHVTGTTTTGFDSAGDKTTTTDADGDTTTYAYGVAGHPGLVSSETDPDGTVTTFTYNGEGEVTSEVKSFGSYSATTLYAYDSLGRKYCEVDPYEAANSVTCPASPPSSPPTPGDDPYLGATITSYDADGRVVQSTNPIGGITYTSYDQAGEAFCSVAPYESAQGVSCPSTAPSSPPPIGDDPYLGATITSYDPSGRAIQVTNPLGGITVTSYDSASNVIQTTVESNNSTTAPNVVTTMTYDADNRVVSSTSGAGSSSPSTTLSSYDPNGDVFCSVSANAYAAGSSAYQCPNWQASWVTTPPNPSSLYSSHPNSAQANNVTTTFHDANGDQIQSTNADVHTSMSAVDANGRTYCSSDPTNVSAWLSAHPSGSYPYLCPSSPPSTPPALDSNPGYTTTIFDAAGRKLSTTDQVGDTTSSSYDPAGHVTEVTDPQGETTTSCYYWENGAGQCAASAPSGGGSGDDLYETTTPATSQDPSGETKSYTYYPGDEKDVTTTPAGQTTDSYDANLDLASVTYSNTASGYSTPANLSYSYYPDGSRHTMTDATGTTTYSKDAQGDVTEQQFSASGQGLTSDTVSYGYFSTGVLASVTYPSYGSYSNPTAHFSYDATGQMTGLSDWLGNNISFAHDADGNLTSQDNAVSVNAPNGTSSTAFSYDAADQNTEASSTLNQTCSGQTETLTQSFAGSTGSRNADGQVTQDQESYTNSCSGQTSYQRAYSYDVAGRVVYQGASAQGANPANLSYDPSGDPTEISSHDGSGNFDTYTQVFDSAGELEGQTPVSGSQGVASSYSYDTLGDRTQSVAGSSTSNYGYDQLGQMTSSSSSGTSDYTYTGDGLEAAVSSGGSVLAQLTWDTNGSLPLVLSDATADYLYGPSGEPVEEVNLATSTPTYMTYTSSDSSWLLTNSAGDEVDFYRYDALGTLSLGTQGSSFGFAGQYLDNSSNSSGLYDMRARWFDPQAGEFTTRDPAFSQTDQAYVYAGDDPVNESDPTGEVEIKGNAGTAYLNVSYFAGGLDIVYGYRNLTFDAVSWAGIVYVFNDSEPLNPLNYIPILQGGPTLPHRALQQIVSYDVNIEPGDKITVSAEIFAAGIGVGHFGPVPLPEPGFAFSALLSQSLIIPGSSAESSGSSCVPEVLV